MPHDAQAYRAHAVRVAAREVPVRGAVALRAVQDVLRVVGVGVAGDEAPDAHSVQHQVRHVARHAMPPGDVVRYTEHGAPHGHGEDRDAQVHVGRGALFGDAAQDVGALLGRKVVEAAQVVGVAEGDAVQRAREGDLRGRGGGVRVPRQGQVCGVGEERLLPARHRHVRAAHSQGPRGGGELRGKGRRHGRDGRAGCHQSCEMHGFARAGKFGSGSARRGREWTEYRCGAVFSPCRPSVPRGAAPAGGPAAGQDRSRCGDTRPFTRPPDWVACTRLVLPQTLTMTGPASC